MRNNFGVRCAGKNRSWVNIALMAVKIPLQMLTKGYVRGGVYWDWYGFGDYILAQKKS
jgi:hypothetical protein